MQVLYVLQINDFDTLDYQFNGDIITVTYNGEVDTFDFTNMPDGKATSYDRHNTGIISTLPDNIQPVIDAVKENGVLQVRLLKFIPMSTPQDQRVSDWIEV